MSLCSKALKYMLIPAAVTIWLDPKPDVRIYWGFQAEIHEICNFLLIETWKEITNKLSIPLNTNTSKKAYTIKPLISPLMSFSHVLES